MVPKTRRGLPARERHRRRQRVHRARAAAIRLGREIRAAVVQQHARPGHHHAAAERQEQALVQADRHAAGVDDAEIDRVAAEGGGVERADEARVQLRIVGCESVDRLEAPEASSTRWPRLFGGISHTSTPAKRLPHRRHPLGPVRREVCRRERRRRRVRDGPVVEARQRRSSVSASSGCRSGPSARKMRAASGIVAQQLLATTP